MRFISVIALAVAFSSQPVLAAKLYKVVDANGNVTFTQYPPEKLAKNSKIEGVQAQGNNQSKVVRRGAYSYCGDIRLPSTKNGAQYLERKLNYRTKDWQDELKQLEYWLERMSHHKADDYKRDISSKNQAYRDRSYQDILTNGKKEMRDLRCALDWASNARLENKDDVKELGRLETLYSNVKQQLTQHCGPVPQYDPSDPKAKAARTDWYNCSKQYRQQLKSLKSKIKRSGG